MAVGLLYGVDDSPDFFQYIQYFSLFLFFFNYVY